MKLVVEEPESPALARRIDREQPDLVACWLLETEMHRAMTANAHVLGLTVVAPEPSPGV